MPRLAFGFHVHQVSALRFLFAPFSLTPSCPDMSEPNMGPMPPEILVDVFKLAIGNPVASSPARDKIGILCKAWRSVLYSTSSLWSTISALSFVNNGIEQADTSALKLCLQYSGRRPLDVDLAFGRNVEADENATAVFRQVFCLVFANVARWRTFSFDGDACIVQSYEWARIFHTPNIEALKIEMGWIRTTVTPAITEACRTSVPTSLLRHLHLDLDFPFFPSNYPQNWCSLVSLSVRFQNAEEARKFLHATTQLQSLAVRWVDYPNSQAAAPVRLAHLKNLSVAMCISSLHGSLGCSKSSIPQRRAE